jgi:hypothetical protein
MEASGPNIGRGPDNPVRANQLMRVRDIADIPEQMRRRASKRVQELSVRDLEDLALKLSGVPTRNPTIDKLTFDDMQSLEDVFSGFKQAKFEQLSAQGETIGDLGDDASLRMICDYTCCCCTPCCCCAAAETEPVAH